MRHLFVLWALAITLSASSLAYTSTQQTAAVSPELVSFPAQDGWLIYANLYGKGDRGVVLAHGGRCTKETWEKQAQALVKAGFRVLAFDFRGFGQSKSGPPGQSSDSGQQFDVLAAVRYLRKAGAQTVAVVGASFGGDATTAALAEAAPGEIDRIVLLAHGAYGPPERMNGRKLFIVTRDDANDAGLRLPKIRQQYERAPKPKELVILEGSAHAQFVFETNQGERLMREILRFLSER
jgi:pimeloyl-ACP methyl ester carboxylesterase